MTYRIVAEFLPDMDVSAPAMRHDSGLVFATEDAAIAWMEGPKGDAFAALMSLESESMTGYFLDDIYATEGE